MADRPVRVAILGLGFMGRTHLRAYSAAARDGLPCEVVAACAASRGDWDSLIAGDGSRAGNIAQAGASAASLDPSRVRFTTEWESIAADPSIDLVSVCTPTDTHPSLAASMLHAGKHVLVEKPVALTSLEARVVAEAARAASARGLLCMPAHCMRFWSGWDWLKARVTDRAFGPLRALTLQRMGSRPDWSRSYYTDVARCGGALFDLHVHDADIVLWLLGAPSTVSSVGHTDHIVTQYRYTSPDAPRVVVAEGAWVTDGFPFRMRYTAEFEDAVADWDLARPEPLLLARGGKAEPVPLPPVSGYDGEIRHMINAVAAARRGERIPLTVAIADAVRVCELLELERESAESGREIEIDRLYTDA